MALLYFCYFWSRYRLLWRSNDLPPVWSCYRLLWRPVEPDQVAGLLLDYVTIEGVDHHLVGARRGRRLFLDRSGWGSFLSFIRIPGDRDLRFWG